MRWARHLLLTVIAGTMLLACGSTPPPATPSRPTASAAPASSVAPASSETPASSPPPTTSKLTQDTQDAFRAAMKAHPGANFDKCTRSTPLTDTACGAGIRAASKVAADTARRLRQQDPKYADVLYGSVLTTANSFQGDVDRLRDPIPCYGLSDKPEPPPPLRAEAQSICAEGADNQLADPPTPGRTLTRSGVATIRSAIAKRVRPRTVSFRMVVQPVVG
jgi:hypothetical protein